MVDIEKLAKPRDPVHYVDQAGVDALDQPYGAGWYFWDETQAHRRGPYDTEAEARRELSEYITLLDRPAQWH